MSCKLMTAMGTKKQNVPADNFINGGQESSPLTFRKEIKNN